MTYYATPPRVILSLALILILSSFIFSMPGDLPMLLLNLLITLFILVALFVRYEFTINSNKLSFQILLFSLVIYAKAVGPEQIEHIKFRRFGWGTMGAVVKVNKGFNLRLINFTPFTMFDALRSFSRAHQILIEKTNDYILLEKMKKRRMKTND